MNKIMNKIFNLFLFIGIIILVSSCNYDSRTNTITQPNFVNKIDTVLKTKNNKKHIKDCECDCNVCNHGGCPEKQIYMRKDYRYGFNTNRYYKYFIKYYRSPNGMKYSSEKQLPIICDCELYMLSNTSEMHCLRINMITYLYSIHNIQQPIAVRRHCY